MLKEINLDLKETWEDYYSDHIDTAIKDHFFFHLEIRAILESIESFLLLHNSEQIAILEIGCATGYLLKQISKKFDKKYNIKLTGVDFSTNAINQARKRNIPNATFIEDNMLYFFNRNSQTYNLIITQRTIMALLERNEQISFLTAVKCSLKENGMGVFSECLKSGLDELNKLRRQLNIEPILKVWHSRYLEKEIFEDIFSQTEYFDFSSLYWLVTRVIYPFFEEPVHNSKIAEFTAQLPQLGNFGLAKLIKVNN